MSDFSMTLTGITDDIPNPNVPSAEAPLFSLRLKQSGELEYRSQLHPEDAIAMLTEFVAQLTADLPKIAEAFEADRGNQVANGHQH